MSSEVIRQEYEDRPSCLRHLYESSARQQLVDFFLELGAHWDEDSDPLTKQDIIDLTGLQRRSVIDHAPVLVEMGVAKINDEHRFDRYEPAVEKDTYNALIEVNNLLGEHYENYAE